MLLIVVDYGVGNLRSIAKSIEKANSDSKLNYTVKVSSDINDVKKSDKIVLPGQGSFKACKNGINNIKGLKEELDELTRPIIKTRFRILETKNNTFE